MARSGSPQLITSSLQQESQKLLKFYVVVFNKKLRTVQDDLLARVIIGKFACGKLMANFISASASEHAQFETKWWILYWRFLHRTVNCQY